MSVVIVSIHASVKDATLYTLGAVSSLGFNPRVREGRDIEAQQAAITRYVSIHASVKDATHSTMIDAITADVSIHASVKDATRST